MNRRSRRGTALLEFALLGVPLIFIIVSVVSASIDMWEYHCLAWATMRTARYVSVHGVGCLSNGNSCAIQVKDVAQFFESQALALDRSKTTLTLKDAGGTVTTCSPVTSCEASTTVFPPSGYNNVGSNITVKSYYTLDNPIVMTWMPFTFLAGGFPVGATSRQSIVF